MMLNFRAKELSAVNIHMTLLALVLSSVPKLLAYMALRKSRPSATTSIASLPWILTVLEDVDMAMAALEDTVMDEVAMAAVEDMEDMVLIKW